MDVIDFEVRLFDTTSLAADGSNIPRRSCEEYIASPDYKIIVRDKVAIGGLTHKDRRLTPDLKGLVGMDDQVLINDNALFYITRLYFKEGDEFLYARARTFDPDLFAGKRAENIYNLIGMLKSGVRMPISVVIQAMWSKRGVAERIIRIKGFDFTQNPSFKGAGDIHVFSETIEDKQICATEEEIKSYSDAYSDGELELRTVVYSSEGCFEVLEDENVGTKQFSSQHLFERILSKSDQKEFSYQEIVSCYGMGSPQVALISKSQGRKIERETLENIADSDSDKQEVTDNGELELWMNRLQNHVDEGNRDLIQHIFRSGRDRIQKIITSVPESDPNRDEMIEVRITQFLRTVPELKDVNFSDIGSIAVRTRTQEQPRFTKINRIISSYKDFSQTKKLTEDQKLRVKLLFLQDINLLIKEVLPQVFQGKSLNSLYALGRYGDSVKASSIELSNTYRKVLIAEKMMNFVPKTLYGEWVVDVRKFYQALCQYTFGEQLTEVQLNLIDIK